MEVKNHFNLSTFTSYKTNTLKSNTLENNYRQILKDLGENPDREGLLKTPERVAKAMKFLTNGYEINPDDIDRKSVV